MGGTEGIDVFFGGEGGPTIAPGATPRGWTAVDLAIGDFDGDGAMDLAVAREAGLGVALNRGDGLLEAAPLPVAAADRVRVGDVDGDCVDDVVALSEGGGAVWVAGAPDRRFAEAVALGADVVDAEFADLEGSGVRALWLLRADGTVEAYAP